MNAVTSFWLITKAVVAVLPLLVMMIREGKIAKATAAEIEDAFGKRWAERLRTAKSATGENTDEETDPFNRSRS